MAVPVHHGYGVTRFDSQAGEPRSEPADALDQRSVVEALHVSVDDVLVRAVRERRMQQVLDEQWVLVRRRRVFDEICGGWLAERRRHRLHPPNSVLRNTRALSRKRSCRSLSVASGPSVSMTHARAASRSAHIMAIGATSTNEVTLARVGLPARATF